MHACLRRRPGARWAIAIVVVHNYRSYAGAAVPYFSASRATAANNADEVEVLSRTCELIAALIDHFVGKASLLSADNDRRDPWRTAALPAPAGLKVWLEQRQP